MQLVILTICLTITTGNKRHVANSVEPVCEDPPVYDVSNWVNNLHLQKCVIVEIGQGHCALFVESAEPSPHIREYFLGICEKDTIMKWRLCSTVLENLRPTDCMFNNDTIEDGVRVHRRLCDISNLAFYGEPCQCDTTFSKRTKYKVSGFPTCFLNPLPDSICSPLNVCGLQSCNTTTAVGRIHMATCNPACLGRQPFCELPALQTNDLPEISSFWTDWSDPLCSEPTCSSGMLYTEATCVNSVTGAGAVDCLGPGTSCCPRDVLKCKCNTYMENGVLKVYRTYVNPLRNHTEERNVRRFKRDVNSNPDELFLKRMFEIVGGKHNNATKQQKKVREIETTEDYEDDDDNDDADGEDIAMEEDMEDEKSSSTTESPEKAEMKMKMLQDEVTANSTNVTQLGDEINRKAGQSSKGMISTSSRTKIVLLGFFGIAWCAIYN